MGSFFSNSIYSVINKVFNVLLTFVTLVIIARTLGPAGQGEYSLLVQLSRTFFYFFSLGFPTAFVFYFGRKVDIRADLLKTYLFVSIVLSFIALFFGYVFTELGYSSFFRGIERRTIYLSLIGILLWFGNSITGGVFTGQEKFKRLNINQAAQPLILFISIVILYFSERLNVENAIISYILSLSVTLILNLYHLWRDDFRLNLRNSKFKKEIIRNSTVYAFKNHVGSVSEFLIYKVDIYIIAYFLPKASLGLYVIAVNIVERIWMFSEPVSSVLFAKLVNVKEETQRDYFSIRTLQVTFLISLIGASGLLAFSAIFVKFFFGLEYEETVLFIYVLLPGVVLQSTALMIKKILTARGYPGTNAKASMFCLILNICLNIILIPKFEVMGAAVATSFTYILFFLIQANSLKIKFGIQKRAYIILSPYKIKSLLDQLLIKRIKK